MTQIPAETMVLACLLALLARHSDFIMHRLLFLEKSKWNRVCNFEVFDGTEMKATAFNRSRKHADEVKLP